MVPSKKRLSSRRMNKVKQLVLWLSEEATELSAKIARYIRTHEWVTGDVVSDDACRQRYSVPGAPNCLTPLMREFIDVVGLVEAFDPTDKFTCAALIDALEHALADWTVDSERRGDPRLEATVAFIHALIDRFRDIEAIADS